jgi:hypothetical protein
MSTPRPPEGTSTPSWSWYHGTITTYGAWLSGDPRGFRTRHHRQHVDGDYKHPPEAGMYDGLERASHESLAQPVVAIPVELRPVVGIALLQRLQQLGGVVVAMSVATEHVHILAKMPVRRARLWIGLAKKHAWFELRAMGWRGKLWGSRSKPEIVRGRRHQLNVYHYILRHESQGAWVWKWGDS